MSILIPVAPTGGPSLTLESLQVLERLGGSEGYLKHLQNPTRISASEIAKSTDISDWVATICEVELGQNWICTWANILTLDGHKTHAEGWGYSSARASRGMLFCYNWEEMQSGECTFEAKTGDVGEGGRLIIDFVQGIKPVGKYIGSEPCLSRVHFEGTCTWSPVFRPDE